MTNKAASAIALLTALACFGAALSPPYGYYVLLRCVVSGTIIFLLLNHRHILGVGGTWLLIVTAIVFNPIAKVHLGRELWQVVDILAGGMFAWIALALNRKS